MKPSKSFLIRCLKHQISTIKKNLAKGLKSLKFYILDLIDLEKKLEQLMDKPVLIGTEKQLPWANEIRDRVFYILENVEEVRLTEALNMVCKGTVHTPESVLNTEQTIKKDYDKFVAKYGKEKTDAHFESMRQVASELKAKALEILDSVSISSKYLEGLNNVSKLERMQDAGLWIDLFKSISDVSWKSYKSILVILRGDFMSKLP